MSDLSVENQNNSSFYSPEKNYQMTKFDVKNCYPNFSWFSVTIFGPGFSPAKWGLILAFI